MSRAIRWFETLHNGTLTRHLHVASTDENAEKSMSDEVKKFLAKGRAVTYPDGSREWINVEEDFERDEDGIPREIFAKDGNRSRHSRTHVKVAADGTRTETALRKSWRVARDDLPGRLIS